MIKTKNENPQNMLTGRVSGVRIWQKSAEPGTYNNSMDIRGLGEPLVVIDGVPRSTEDFQRLNANDIENVSVLKDASASFLGSVTYDHGAFQKGIVGAKYHIYSALPFDFDGLSGKSKAGKYQ